MSFAKSQAIKSIVSKFIILRPPKHTKGLSSGCLKTFYYI